MVHVFLHVVGCFLRRLPATRGTARGSVASKKWGALAACTAGPLGSGLGFLRSGRMHSASFQGLRSTLSAPTAILSSGPLSTLGGFECFPYMLCSEDFAIPERRRVVQYHKHSNPLFHQLCFDPNASVFFISILVLIEVFRRYFKLGF